MAESVSKEPAVTVNSAKSKLRYPLRSATKSKEEKPPVVDPANSSASRRGKTSSTVSKSVSVLDLSAKEKSAKPPRRLSVPAKSAGSAAKSVGNITPISETREKRLANTRGKSETPLSDVSRASSRKKFNVLSSASYWLAQIKHSESAAKHSISLGFFKLALEAGCEPLQKMRDELKSYARRNNLSECGEPVKDLFDSYNITETSGQLQVSETCSQVPEEGTRSSDDEVHSSSSAMGTRKLKPKSLNVDVAQVYSVTESVKKETAPKNYPSTRTRASLNKHSVNSRSFTDNANRKIQKKPTKQETNKEKDRIKLGKKSAGMEVSVSPPAKDKVEENDKENLVKSPYSTQVIKILPRWKRSVSE